MLTALLLCHCYIFTFFWVSSSIACSSFKFFFAFCFIIVGIVSVWFTVAKSGLFCLQLNKLCYTLLCFVFSLRFFSGIYLVLVLTGALSIENWLFWIFNFFSIAFAGTIKGFLYFFLNSDWFSWFLSPFRLFLCCIFFLSARPAFALLYVFTEKLYIFLNNFAEFYYLSVVK